MKKLALILGMVILFGIGVNAQQQRQRSSTRMKDTTQMKKSTKKSTSRSYQMNKDTSKPGTAKGTTRGSMEKMEDTSKVKSKGEPVYKH